MTSNAADYPPRVVDAVEDRSVELARGRGSPCPPATLE